MLLKAVRLETTIYVPWYLAPTVSLRLQVSGEDIKTTLDKVDTELELGRVYGNRPPGVYHLNAMFCYYGQHYHAFIHKVCRREGRGGC